MDKSETLEIATLPWKMPRKLVEPSKCLEHTKHHQDAKSAKSAESTEDYGRTQHVELKE